LYQRGYTSPKQIAEKLKLHPFVVKQRLNKINQILLDQENLKNIFKKLLNLELQLKTGKLPQEIFWLQLSNIFSNK
jgi:DNA polymerase III delta subunit